MILTLAVEEASGEAVWLLVDRNAEGVDVTHLSTTGGDQQCHVTFRDTPVPDGQPPDRRHRRLGGPRAGPFSGARSPSALTYPEPARRSWTFR